MGSNKRKVFDRKLIDKILQHPEQVSLKELYDKVLTCKKCNRQYGFDGDKDGEQLCPICLSFKEVKSKEVVDIIDGKERKSNYFVIKKE